MKILLTIIMVAMTTGMIAGAFFVQIGANINLGPFVPLLLLVLSFCYTGHLLWGDNK